MGAYAFEYDLAKAVGVRGMFSCAPEAILGNGSVRGVRFVRTEVRNGKVEPIDDSAFEVECDAVIRATGQTKQTALLGAIGGLELDGKGRIVVDADGMTTRSGIYAAGDAVNGGVEVVNAVAEAKRAAQGMHRILSSNR